MILLFSFVQFILPLTKICPYVCSVKQFVALVKKLDVNLDTISTKVNSALTRLEKKYDVMLALYQRFEKWVDTLLQFSSLINVEP